MVNASFEETYKVLEQLFLRYDIKIISYSSSGGEIKINYRELDADEWKNFGTEPWAIDSDKYLFKIGVYKGKSTITIYDDLNKALETNVVARMYSGFAISLANEFEKYRAGDIIVTK
jgi:outer membrane protein assembly factor BamC